MNVIVKSSGRCYNFNQDILGGMVMKLEQNDIPLLFSFTNIPDVFFTEYLAQANGDFIKVYLYMLFLSKYNKEIKITDLCKKLNLQQKTIQEAVKFWEQEGAITKKNTGFIMNQLQEIELHKLYSPRTALSAEELKKSAESKYRAQVMDNINNLFFQGMMSPSWYNDIDLWFKKYQFDEEVMLALFQYCYNRSAMHRNYIQTVADAWYKNKVKTFNDLDLYWQKLEKMNVLTKTISKKLGFNRSLTQFEESYIEKWNVEYGYDLDVIELALKKTTSKSNPNFEYLNTLLTNWYEHGLKTADEVQQYVLQMKQKTKDIKELEKKTNYANYDQRNYANLENLYANQ